MTDMLSRRALLTGGFSAMAAGLASEARAVTPFDILKTRNGQFFRETPAQAKAHKLVYFGAVIGATLCGSDLREIEDSVANINRSCGSVKIIPYYIYPDYNPADTDPNYNAVLKFYLNRTGTSLVGLHAPFNTVSALAQRYKSFYLKGQFGLEHSRFATLFSPQWQLVKKMNSDVFNAGGRLESEIRAFTSGGQKICSSQEPLVPAF